MQGIRRAGRPWVFLSFAGADREKADRLRVDLEERDVGTLSFQPGIDLVQAIDRALTQSDYFVLLWSRAAADSEWVKVEWSAAFTRALQEQRSFLFVVRLDATPLPTLLAPRYYLDACTDWNGMVNELVTVWQRDWAIGEPVLPAPSPEATRHGASEAPTLDLYVRNRALSVAHVIVAAAETTGEELARLVREQLALPHAETNINGAVAAHFDYRLKSAGIQLPADDTTLAQLHITDGARIDLEIQVQWDDPTGSSHTVTYRGGPSPGPSRELKRFPSFGHLIPW